MSGNRVKAQVPRAVYYVVLGIALILAAATLSIVSLSRAYAASVAFVQGRDAQVTSGTTASLAFSKANTAGNLIVVYVVWDNPGTVNVSDTRGDTYTAATAPQTWGSNWSAQVFYASSILGGSNTVKASFGTAISSFGIVYLHEYSGLAEVSPADVSASAVGTSASMSSGAVTTTQANDLLFAAGASDITVSAGTGFTARLTGFGNLTEDRVVTTTGSYAGTASQTGSTWVMQLVAFRVATGVGPPAKLAFVQGPSSTGAGAAIAPAVKVAVEDANGSVETSDNATQVSLAIGTTPSGGTLSGGSAVTVASGIATFPGLSINMAGTGYTLTAASTPSYTAATSAAFNMTTGAPPYATSVSASGTYLVDQYGNPFLVNGDFAWNVAWGLDSADQTTYLLDRQADGFNTVVTDLVGNNTMYGSSNGANYEGDTPFTGSNFTPNPAYWSKIDTFFQLAEKYGITVFALSIDAYATTGSNVFSTMTDAQASAFGTFLADRYPQSQYPGIVWVLGNDYDGDGAGNGNVGGFASQYQAFLNALTAAGDTRPTTIEQGIFESLSTDGHTIGQMVTLNAGYSYHPCYEVILRGRAAKNIPVLFFEGAYENNPNGFPSAPLDIRKQLGWSMTSGAAGTFYGNDSLWEFQAGWQNQLDTSDVAQRKAFDAAFTGINWQNLQPDVDSQLVVSGRNREFTAWSTGSTPYTNDATYGNYVSAAYTPDGTLGMIYNPDTTKNQITISSSVFGANPTITAVDPTDGARTSLGWTTTPTMGTNAGGDHDWLFIIIASPKS